MTYQFTETVRVALADVIERPVTELKDDMLLDRDFDLDSVMFVHFLLSLEDSIEGLQFNPEDLAEASFNEVGKLLAHLEQFAQTTEGQVDESEFAPA